MISLDTETTGVDFWHGARPFFVTVCHDDGRQEWWEWDVDPMTREVDVPEEDAREIRQLLAEQHNGIVLQNSKFDAAALRAAEVCDWKPLWELTHDTLIAGHVLASNQPHDLTSMALHYLGVDIQPLEDQLHKACEEARRYCRSRLPEWAIAQKGRPDMPSAKEKCWKFDTWMPKALAREIGHPNDHPWHTVLADYANADSNVTLKLWKAMRSELERQDLWEIYLTRLQCQRLAHDMERRGVTLSGIRLDGQRARYSVEAEGEKSRCTSIASSLEYDLELPKSGNNGSLRKFVFGPLNLPALATSDKTGEPSLDKHVLEQYESILPPRSKQLLFVRSLKGMRKRVTAVNYLDGYKRYWLESGKGWFILHPSLNPTGTDTLRWSSSNPNEQNISKQEGFNLRYVFGPAPGREWWSLDAQNLELRIPAYEAGERDLIEVFDHPEKPPYFGSYHLVVCDLLWPKEFAKFGKHFKDEFRSTLYQRVKNGNFAIIYGAQEETADRTYGVPGAYAKIWKRFPKIAELSRRQMAFAEKHGYVETIPDRTVNPRRGYPLMCSRSQWGKVSPTVPLNYHIQGTAMWWTLKAMIRCDEQLSEWKLNGFDAWMAIQQHDEIVFDLPKGLDPGANLPRVQSLADLMEQGGKDIGVKTPVGIEHHPDNWSEGTDAKDI